MKTVWIIDHYSSEPKYGGISRQYDFANELAKRGYKVIVISSLFSHFTHKYIEDGDMYVSNISDKVTYIYLKTAPYTENGGTKRLRNMISFQNSVIKNMKFIADTYGAPDVVNACSVHPFAWTAGYVVARKFKARFCVEVRDLWPEVWVLSGKKTEHSPMVIFTRMLEKWIYKKSDAIIYSMSKGDLYINGKLGIDNNKLYLIGQPMDMERFDKNAKVNYNLVPKEIRDFINDSFVCTFAGYYMTYEGIYTMLEAAKTIKAQNLPIKMVFVGSGEEEQGMRNFVNEHKLDNVIVGNRISKEAIPGLLKNSDIVMAHLAVEGHEDAYKYGVSKNKVNEYLYSGSVTLYGFHDNDDVVATSGGGFVFEPFNSNDLFNNIIKVYEMTKEDRRKIGNKGRVYTSNNQSSEVLTDKLESVLFKK